MNTGIIITARLGSTRLKKKHLLSVNDNPLIHYLVKRIELEFEKEINEQNTHIIIATADLPENQAFETIFNGSPKIFYGSPQNIPLRHFECARKHHLDSIISIDGDDILCSVEGMRSVFNAFAKGYEYVSTSNLPLGMNSSGYSRNYLEKSLESNSNQEILETGWGRIFDQGTLHNIQIPFSKDNDILRFTLDYPEDYEFFKSIILHFGESIYKARDEEIINYVLSNNLYSINESVTKKYWENFHTAVKKETQ